MFSSPTWPAGGRRVCRHRRTPRTSPSPRIGFAKSSRPPPGPSTLAGSAKSTPAKASPISGLSTRRRGRSKPSNSAMANGSCARPQPTKPPSRPRPSTPLHSSLASSGGQARAPPKTSHPSHLWSMNRARGRERRQQLHAGRITRMCWRPRSTWSPRSSMACCTRSRGRCSSTRTRKLASWLDCGILAAAAEMARGAG